MVKFWLTADGAKYESCVTGLRKSTLPPWNLPCSDANIRVFDFRLLRSPAVFNLRMTAVRVYTIHSPIMNIIIMIITSVIIRIITFDIINENTLPFFDKMYITAQTTPTRAIHSTPPCSHILVPSTDRKLANEVPLQPDHYYTINCNCSNNWRFTRTLRHGHGENGFKGIPENGAWTLLLKDLLTEIIGGSPWSSIFPMM